MNPEVFKSSTLAIAVAGLLILITGITLFIFRDNISGNVRFFMPIPPLAVSSYIFVFNMYNYYGGRLPEGNWVAVKEILFSTAVAAVAFGVFTLLMIGIIDFLER